MGERLVADFCPAAMQKPMEIDIDRFVSRYLGMVLDYQWLSHKGIYLGMTVFEDTDKVPVYDATHGCADYIRAAAGTVIIDNSLLEEKQEHRYRYTMGHEGSHGILHPGYYACDPNQLSFYDEPRVPMIACRKDGPHKPLNLWTDKDRMEWQANFLSSAILMPMSMVRDLIAETPLCYTPLLPAQYVLAVSNTFNVSLEAAEYRLKHLDIIAHNTTISKACFDFLSIAT